MYKASKLEQRKFRFSTYKFRNYSLNIAFDFSPFFMLIKQIFDPCFSFLSMDEYLSPLPPDGEIDLALAESPGLVDSQLNFRRHAKAELKPLMFFTWRTIQGN